LIFNRRPIESRLRAAFCLQAMMSESGTNRTSGDLRSSVAIRGKPDIARKARFRRAPSGRRHLIVFRISGHALIAVVAVDCLHDRGLNTTVEVRVLCRSCK
jgi:hypothetical protein